MREKICKGCGKKFKPNTTLQQVCPKYSCYNKWEKLKEKINKDKLEKETKDYKKLAWTQISKYVRYTSSIKDDQGKVKCYTCSKIMRPEEADTGHFKHNKLDDDLRNLKIQCSKCNRYLSGNLSEYRKNLVRDFGEEWVQQLEIDANKCKPKKNHEWEEIYLKFKELNKV